MYSLKHPNTGPERNLHPALFSVRVQIEIDPLSEYIQAREIGEGAMETSRGFAELKSGR